MLQNTLPTARRGVPIVVQLLIWLGLLGLLLLLAAILVRAQHPTLAVGSTVPDFTLPLYDGYELEHANTLRLSDLRGRVVLINFWASWCSSCGEEAALLETVWREYKPAGEVVFIGIGYQDTPASALTYLRRFEVTYPNGPDQGSRISQLFNRTPGVPETYIVDRQGILRFSKAGPFLSAEEIREAVESVRNGE